ncbi:hypothetical protein ABZT04_44105 [Streptomyces sp. NPDC005492]|uniref:hypothetical protein n=1 Tax=Streptomyces sp. NPDC005492 TaxID=3156883 RepID=UPI0033BEA4DB
MTDTAVELETVEPVESAQLGQPEPVSDEHLVKLGRGRVSAMSSAQWRPGDMVIDKRRVGTDCHPCRSTTTEPLRCMASSTRSGTHWRRVDWRVPVRANRQPGWGAYVRDSVTGRLHVTDVVMVALFGDRIGEMTRFETTLAPYFSPPLTLGRTRAAMKWRETERR